MTYEEFKKLKKQADEDLSLQRIDYLTYRGIIDGAINEAVEEVKRLSDKEITLDEPIPFKWHSQFIGWNYIMGVSPKGYKLSICGYKDIPPKHPEIDIWDGLKYYERPLFKLLDQLKKQLSVSK